MTSSSILRELSKYLQTKYANYLLRGGSYETNINLPPNQRLDADELRFFDLVRDNAAGLRVEDLLPYMSDTSGDTIQELRDYLAPLSRQPQEPVRAPLSIEQVAAGQVQPGSVPIRTDIEPGELSRPTRTFATGAEDIEPGEMSRSGMGTAAGSTATVAGGTSQQVLATDPLGRPTQGLGFGRGDGRATTVATGPSRPGGAVVTDVAETPADANIPEDWRTAAAQAYPQYYAIVRNIPEIASLLERAVAESFTPEEFQAQLEQTGWWQQTTASAREWEISGQRDPATQQRLLDEQRLTVRSIALNTFGVNLSDESLNRLSEDSLKYGWSSAFLSNAIGDLATQSTAGVSQLRQGYIGQNIRQTARKYGVTLSDVTFNSFVNRIAVGEETADSFENYALNIARVLYPTLQSQFDAGLTFDDAVDPYRQVAASTLELAPDQIDFTDPKWLTPITYMPDPTTGEQRLMNLAEWGKELRTNRAYGYEFTTNAKNQAYSVVETLGNLFGRI